MDIIIFNIRNGDKVNKLINRDIAFFTINLVCEDKLINRDIAFSAVNLVCKNKLAKGCLFNSRIVAPNTIVKQNEKVKTKSLMEAKL
jgi:hypothetical protein